MRLERSCQPGNSGAGIVLFCYNMVVLSLVLLLLLTISCLFYNVMCVHIYMDINILEAKCTDLCTLKGN